MGHRDRIRVEFSLPPDLAERVYRYAKDAGLTLSQTGARLLAAALRCPPDTTTETAAPDTDDRLAEATTATPTPRGEGQ
jgi:hypothetical protein